MVTSCAFFLTTIFAWQACIYEFSMYIIKLNFQTLSWLHHHSPKSSVTRSLNEISPHMRFYNTNRLPSFSKRHNITPRVPPHHQLMIIVLLFCIKKKQANNGLPHHHISRNWMNEIGDCVSSFAEIPTTLFVVLSWRQETTKTFAFNSIYSHTSSIEELYTPATRNMIQYPTFIIIYINSGWVVLNKRLLRSIQ